MKNRVYLLPIVALSCFFACAYDQPDPRSIKVDALLQEYKSTLTPAFYNELKTYTRHQYDNLVDVYDNESALNQQLKKFAGNEHKKLFAEQDEYIKLLSKYDLNLTRAESNQLEKIAWQERANLKKLYPDDTQRRMHHLGLSLDQRVKEIRSSHGAHIPRADIVYHPNPSSVPVAPADEPPPSYSSLYPILGHQTHTPQPVSQYGPAYQPFPQPQQQVAQPSALERLKLLWYRLFWPRIRIDSDLPAAQQVVPGQQLTYQPYIPSQQPVQQYQAYDPSIQSSAPQYQPYQQAPGEIRGTMYGEGKSRYTPEEAQAMGEQRLRLAEEFRKQQAAQQVVPVEQYQPYPPNIPQQQAQQSNQPGATVPSQGLSATEQWAKEQWLKLIARNPPQSQPQTQTWWNRLQSWLQGGQR